MSNEELVALIQSGERDRLPELWTQVERFVRRQARKWMTALQELGGVTGDDLYQAGYLAMLEAVDSYRADKGKAFIGWFAYHLKTAFTEAYGLRTTRQQRDPLQRALRLETPLDDLEGITMGDSIPDPTAEAEITDIAERDREQRLHAALEKAMATLTEAEREVLRARYCQLRTLEEIAAERGISREQVRQTEAKALRTLRHPANSRELRRHW